MLLGYSVIFIANKQAEFMNLIWITYLNNKFIIMLA